MNEKDITANAAKAGVVVRHNKNGFAAIFLHWSASPIKNNKEYAEQIRKGLTEAAYKREHELDFTTLGGTRIFNEFSMAQIAHMDFVEDTYMLRGWDWGRKWPSLTLSQINNSEQWLWHRVFIGDDMLTPTFLEVGKWLCGELTADVLSQPALEYIAHKRLQPWLTYPTKFKFRDFCDQAGNQKTDKANESNIDIAYGPPYNLRMIYSKFPEEKGINLISIRMRKRPDGLYGIMVDDRAFMLIQGLTGGFIRDEKGFIVNNIYTNPFDTLRYVFQNITNERMELQLACGKEENWKRFIKVRPKPSYAVNNS